MRIASVELDEGIERIQGDKKIEILRSPDHSSDEGTLLSYYIMS